MLGARDKRGPTLLAGSRPQGPQVEKSNWGILLDEKSREGSNYINKRPL